MLYTAHREGRAHAHKTKLASEKDSKDSEIEGRWQEAREYKKAETSGQKGCIDEKAADCRAGGAPSRRRSAGHHNGLTLHLHSTAITTYRRKTSILLVPKHQQKIAVEFRVIVGGFGAMTLPSSMARLLVKLRFEFSAVERKSSSS